MSAGEPMTASLTRNPAASSTSSPGVRMVMVSAVPFTLTPSGSSPARKSARDVRPPGRPSPGSVTRSTRRRAVRPDNNPPSASPSLPKGYAPGQLKYVIAVEVPGHAEHSQHDADPGFQEFTTRSGRRIRWCTEDRCCTRSDRHSALASAPRLPLERRDL
jgi:hypothetical protein